MSQISVAHNVEGIAGLCVITQTVHGDKRGYFTETYNRRDMAEAGLNYEFLQDNQSSSTKGVLRGLHYQIHYPQTKLVRVIRGEVYDAAVDVRRGSATFGKYYGIILTEDNHKQLLIPKGFAHGFLVLSDFAEFCYKCDDYWHPNDEGGIIYSDPEINIAWPEVDVPLNIIERDSKLPLLREAVLP